MCGQRPGLAGGWTEQDEPAGSINDDETWTSLQFLVIVFMVSIKLAQFENTIMTASQGGKPVVTARSQRTKMS